MIIIIIIVIVVPLKSYREKTTMKFYSWLEEACFPGPSLSLLSSNWSAVLGRNSITKPDDSLSTTTVTTAAAVAAAGETLYHNHRRYPPIFFIPLSILTSISSRSHDSVTSIPIPYDTESCQVSCVLRRGPSHSAFSFWLGVITRRSFILGHSEATRGET